MDFVRIYNAMITVAAFKSSRHKTLGSFKIRAFSLFFLIQMLILLSAFRYTESISRGKSAYSLFKIERSRDADVVNYDINLNTDGVLNARSPIRIYWIKNSKGGTEENLTWIQRKFGYGVKYYKVSNSMAIFRFVSYINKDFVLKRDEAGCFKVFTFSNNQSVEVNKLYIKFDGGTFLAPKVSEVKIHGINPRTNDKTIEITYQ